MAEGTIRVMIVDDSAVVRGLIVKALAAVPVIEIAGSASNGRQAVELLQQGLYHVIVLDIEMPEMDGLSALPEIIKYGNGARVVMISTRLNASEELAIKALALGAADYLQKPSAQDGADALKKFHQELITKILLLGEKFMPGISRRAVGVTLTAVQAPPTQSKNYKLLDLPVQRADAIAIGSSTGGPQALFKLFEILSKDMPKVPVFITQHMPPIFTKSMANQIAKNYRVDCVEAENSMPVVQGKVYVAPGDFHMEVEVENGVKIIKTNKDEQENFCRPAADPMLRSLSKIYGRNLLVVILTGMGQDGMLGAKEVVANGGTVVAQDEATSVVWGVPGAVAKAGICKAVLPIDQIGYWIHRNIRGGV